MVQISVGPARGVSERGRNSRPNARNGGIQFHDHIGTVVPGTLFGRLESRLGPLRLLGMPAASYAFAWEPGKTVTWPTSRNRPVRLNLQSLRSWSVRFARSTHRLTPRLGRQVSADRVADLPGSVSPAMTWCEQTGDRQGQQRRRLARQSAADAPDRSTSIARQAAVFRHWQAWPTPQSAQMARLHASGR